MEGLGWRKMGRSGKNLSAECPRILRGWRLVGNNKEKCLEKVRGVTKMTLIIKHRYPYYF